MLVAYVMLAFGGLAFTLPASCRLCFMIGLPGNLNAHLPEIDFRSTFRLYT